MEQVPEIAPRVAEDGDHAVRLLRWLANEGDALGAIALIVASEVIGVQEQEHPTASLIADAGALLRR